MEKQLPGTGKLLKDSPWIDRQSSVNVGSVWTWGLNSNLFTRDAWSWSGCLKFIRLSISISHNDLSFMNLFHFSKGFFGQIRYQLVSTKITCWIIFVRSASRSCQVLAESKKKLEWDLQNGNWSDFPWKCFSEHPLPSVHLNIDILWNL